ncbi:hypothetical protein AVEN_190836-1 [Araneus ventricosus]|uniref:Uncharacterized protein n=1 Tax=Araneus ventricosus TaxID=182803 RepID=A0A4Y2E1H6_ARAVE|nr:hypothetical protein AVEN_190836-1 [Araneus ventricosus]
MLHEGVLDGMRHRSETLAPHVRLYAGTFGDSSMLMDDIALPHGANIYWSKYLQRIDLTAVSSNFNLIEDLWDYLERQIWLLTFFILKLYVS